MERLRYSFNVVMSVKAGCFTSDQDLLQYIRFRLGLRSRDSDNIVLSEVTLVNVNNVQEVLL